LEAKYLVYGHYDDAGICFYVGIGNKKRPYGFSIRSGFWKNYVKKHCVSGKPEVKIWHQNLTWEQAQEHEKFWISIYGRRDLGTGVLVNLTDGGEGVANPSEETRQKISEANKGEKNPQYGKTHTKEHCKKISEANKGKPKSDEHRQKISQANKGKPKSDETKQKLSLANKGKIPSDKHREKLSQARKGRPGPNKGKPHSEETRLKMSQANKGERNPRWGKPHSDEARQKMSEARKHYYQKKEN
jgi:hypothetical protein